ncbi:MAG: 16S rRNA (cytosine(1402)-N(4))-methyltransferase RsmH [Chloroflexi bacterium]|nr:16S rRNA (cytosine(1402)-N(4))-methyltransferase RsmH [Chloroflexota bacterium]
MGHVPVLLGESVAALAPRPGGRYLDGTYGGGGHTAALLAACAPDGRVLALDRDPAAVARGVTAAAMAGGRLVVQQANFADLAAVAIEAGFAPLDGILLDLGMSSFQLDEAARGFSFQSDGPLDMRMDPTSGQPASALVNELPERELADLIYEYGEERASRRIARAIVQARARAPLRTTGDLTRAVTAAVGRPPGGLHPATRTFQALRIAVNDELGALEGALAGALTVLAPGGRLVVISFHSLEDRIVKQYFRREATDCLCPPALPVCQCGHRAQVRLSTRRPVVPGVAEAAANPRSRSAKMRVAERLPAV